MRKFKPKMYSHEAREPERLLLSDTLKEVGISQLLISTTLTILCFAVILIFWAMIVNMNEINVSIGNIEPYGKIKQIQHLEGGGIKSVSVKENQLVMQEQILAEIFPTNYKTQVQEVTDALISLNIDKSRLQAILDNTLYDLPYILNNVSYLNKYNLQNYNEIIQNSIELYNQEIAFQQAKNQELSQEIKKNQEELDKTNLIISKTKEQLEIATQKTNMFEQLVDSSISRVAFLDAKSEQSRMNGLLIDKNQQKDQLLKDLTVAENRAQSSILSAKEKIRKQLNEIHGNIMEQETQLIQIQDIFDRTKIRAPFSGVVKDIQIDIGSVVPPGGKIMDLVPIDDPFVAKIKIIPKDIGFVNIGTKVKVKINAYNFANYGSINGYIDRISGTTITDPNDGSHYYNAYIKLEKQYVGNNPKLYQLKSGMTLTADISGKHTTIFHKLFYPVKSKFDAAFQER